MARRGRAYRQAKRDALLRYGPEIGALLELQQQAVSQFNQARNSAKANSRSIINQTKIAAPRIKEVYDDATTANTATANLVNTVGASDDPIIKAALAQEQASALGRISESRADAVTDMQQRRVAAREGRMFAVGQARQDFARDIGSVLRRKGEIGAEQGQFVVSQAAGYRQDAAERRAQARAAKQAYKLRLLGLQQSERSSIRSAGIDPNTGLPIPGGRLDPDANNRPGDQTPKSSGGGSGGAKDPYNKGPDNLRTPAARAEAGDTFDSLVSTVKKYHPHAGGDSIDTLKRRIIQGDPGKEEQAIHDPNTGKPRYDPKTGLPLVKPGRPATKGYNGPEILLDAALEQAILGHITRPTAQRLRRRGLRPRQLGTVQPRHPGRGWVPPQGVAGPK